MIRDFIQKIFRVRHFWRQASFDEVAELYTSRMLRMSALYIISSFVSIFLYQIGYSVPAIAFVWAGFYGLKLLIALPLARLVAYIGPKHAILASNIIYIPAMIAYALLPDYGVWLLPVAIVFQAISATMYSIAYNIDFSKVKSIDRAGRQIAVMNIIEKVTTGLSPLLGGLVALFWGPQVVIVLSALLFAMAAWPLFRTGEPVRIHQKLMFRGFPWRLLMSHALAQISIGFDVFTSGTIWSLYIAIFILSDSTYSNDVYAIVGLLLSVVFIVAIIASYTYGKIIDRRRGKQLMIIGSFANTLTHFSRPFIITPVAIAGLNAANELATTGYLLPYTRAMYDNADLSGSRTTYLGIVEVITNFGACLSAIAAGIATLLFSVESALHGFFFLTGVVVLLVLSARFPIYGK